MNNDLDSFVSELNLPFEGETRGSQYVINLDNSNDFSALFSCVSMNDKLNLDGKSEANVDKAEFRFTDGYYDVFLQADYNEDVYSCTIEER